MLRTSWMTAMVMVGAAVPALAEDVTISTNYHAPTGAYNQLKTTGQTTLAEQGGNVGIGVPAGTVPAKKLEVIGDAQLHGGSGQIGMVVDANGRIGLGVQTPDPLVQVHVRGKAFIDASGGSHALPPGSNVALVVDGAAGQEMVVFRSPGGTEVFKIDELGDVRAGWSGAEEPPLVGKFQVWGWREGQLTNFTAPRARTRFGADQPYSVGVYARNNSANATGVNGNVAIAGIHVGGDGTGLYGEGRVGVIGRGDIAGYFDGVVRIAEDSNANPPVGGRLAVENSVAIGTEDPVAPALAVGLDAAGNQIPVRLGVLGNIHSTAGRLYLTGSTGPGPSGVRMFWIMAGPREAGDPLSNTNGENVIGWTKPNPGDPPEAITTRRIGLLGNVAIGANEANYRTSLFVTGNTGLGIAPQDAFRLYVNGNTRIDGSLNVNGSSCLGAGCVGDVAETIDCPLCEAGDVVVVDPEHDQRLTRSTRAYDPAYAGVISTKPALNIGGSRGESARPLALAGQVPCKVTTKNGPIKRGDLLVTSSTPGYAMRADSEQITPGTLIGKALEPLAEGDGTIVILITGS